MNYAKFEKINLKTHPFLNEKWVQDRIAEDPIIIGLAKNGQASNFIQFRPKKRFMLFEPRLPDSPEMQEQCENAGLDLMDYDKRWGRYRIRLQPSDIEKNKKILEEIISEAYANANKE